MPKTLSFAALLALGVVFGAGPRSALAATPAEYCTFTSPASFVCPAEATPPVRTAATQVQADHCVATTPASSSCPAAPASQISVASRNDTGARLSVSRN